jgi:hypothetical protein
VPKREYQLLLLAALVLGAFYPSVLAGYPSLTILFYLRPGTGHRLEPSRNFSRRGAVTTIVPIGLSFVVDKLVLGLPGVHREYSAASHKHGLVIIWRSMSESRIAGRNNDSLLPMFAAMLFGLPRRSESVNRYRKNDVLAGVFVLSVLFLLKYREHGNTRYIVLSIIAFLCAVFQGDRVRVSSCFLLLLSADGQGRQ